MIRRLLALAGAALCLAATDPAQDRGAYRTDWGTWTLDFVTGDAVLSRDDGRAETVEAVEIDEDACFVRFNGIVLALSRDGAGAYEAAGWSFKLRGVKDGMRTYKGHNTAVLVVFSAAPEGGIQSYAVYMPGSTLADTWRFYGGRRLLANCG